MSLTDIPDHPDIRMMERYGTLHPEIDEDETPICPICGAECETAFIDSNEEALGCENCITKMDAWDAYEYLPKRKARTERML